MIETLREMRETLKMAADVRSCAKHHPWIVTGLAAAVGFAAGVVLTPSPRNRARADLQSEPRQTRSSRGTMMAKRAFATLAGIAAGTVKNIALSSITAAIASQHATPTEPATHRDSDAAEPHCGEGLEL